MEALFDFEEKPEIEKFDDWVKNNFKQYNYRVALPTYKRYDIFKNKTLKTLINSGINPELIDVFVADDSEKELYEKTLTRETYSKIIVGQKGMKEIRNFIQDYYSEGQLIVSFDDDVEKVERFVDEKTLIDFKELNNFFNYAFYVMENYGASCWGVYPVSNPYFMEDSIALGLRFLNGTLYGFSNKSFLKLELDEKEDFERSIKAYIHDGKVIRFDFMTYESKEFTEKGGMQADYKDRNDLAEKSSKYLLEKYPYLCKINTARKNRCEIKLVEQRPEFKADSKKRIKWG